MSVFQDKIAFVTGGGSGLGRALCEQMAARGAVVIVTDVDGEAARRVADSISTKGGRAWAVRLDVCDAASVAKAVDGAVAKYGRLDYMFNNAGIIILSEFRDMGPDHWRRIIGINMFGVLNGTTAAYTHMVRQSSGHIVNIASVSGLVRMPTYSAYAMTKHAVVGLSTSLRAEAARLGVKVTVVCPGPMNTGLGAAATIVRADRSTLESNASQRESMDPNQAARIVLQGVERNKWTIVFPFSARLLWWAHRIHAALLTPLDRWFIRTLSSARTEGKQAHVESAR